VICPICYDPQASQSSLSIEQALALAGELVSSSTKSEKLSELSIFWGVVFKLRGGVIVPIDENQGIIIVWH